jgi:hypothetical protein
MFFVINLLDIRRFLLPRDFVLFPLNVSVTFPNVTASYICIALTAKYHDCDMLSLTVKGII